MKNPLLYLKQKEHQHAFYAVAIFIMLSILFFLLVSLKTPVEKTVEIETIETEIEISFDEEVASSGAPSVAQNIPTPEKAADIAVQSESSISITQATSTPVENAFNFNPSNGSNDGPAFGESDGHDMIDSGKNERGNASRKIVKRPVFDANSQIEGEIALKIWVDANGLVVKTMLDTEQSNSGSKFLIREAIKAAKSMRYDSKPGVPAEYVGTKVFSFKKA